MKKIKLFCLPYAGGSANIYSKWNESLEEHIELCPIELAGRGSRIGERHYTSLNEVVNDIFNHISEDILSHDYAIFGHSLGAFLTYELIQKIISEGLPSPIHSFFSGRTPPGVKRRKKLFSTMNSLEFENAILDLGGTPPDFFKYPELKRIFIPLLRSDFALSETIVERKDIILLNNSVSVLIGEEEGITLENAVKWDEYTSKECTVHSIKGGHFFLLHEQEAVIKIINESLIKKSLEVVA
ncbi:thioesterase domain-containing protein [uncultured Tenacibaculum sp.]|uniref:thioesterase II family protein n=1 Tax=uncultured Tenacibaculum sp. TaxID=174713 RepID=UPI002621F2ED|nr:thioesterase domain-containing protein [uncultured Tenacibaculum sp.]